MGKSTGIAWTRSSFNPWIGCTEVSPGCDHCYARELDKRHRYGGATHWGAGVTRMHTSERYWHQPVVWNDRAELERETGCVRTGEKWHTPGFWPMFPSLCDPFDNEVPAEWRREFWDLILSTPNLTWLLLTKRIGNVASMMTAACRNVWIGASIVNQEEADRDLPKLVSVRGVAKRFVSYEPALGPVDFTPWIALLDQIIVGGESSQGGHQARPFDVRWAYDTLEQCAAAGVACFIKQLGSIQIWDYGSRSPATDRAGADPAEWPDDLRVQEFPK